MIAITNESGCGHCPASLVCWAGQPLVIRVKGKIHKNPFNARSCKRCHCVLLNGASIKETYLCAVLRHIGRMSVLDKMMSQPDFVRYNLQATARLIYAFNEAPIYFTGCYEKEGVRLPPHLTTPRAEWHLYQKTVSIPWDCIEHFRESRQISKTY